MRQRLVIGGSTLAICAATLVPGAMSAGQATPTAARLANPESTAVRTLSGTVPTLVRAATRLGAMDPLQTLHIAVPLTLPNQAALNHLVTAEYTPGTADYHRFIDPATFGREFGAPAARVAAVTRTLTGLGLTVSAPSTSGLYLKASGPAGVVAKAFGTSIENFRLPSGLRFFANTTNVTLPSSLVGNVTGVIGLDDASRPEPQLSLPSKAALKSRPAASGIGPVGQHGGATPCGQAVLGGGYTAPQLATAYNFNGLYAKGLLGQGMSAALVEFDDYHDSNVAAVKSCYGLSTTVSRVVVDGGTGGQPHLGEAEDMADIGTLLQMLPKLKRLDVYVAPITNLGEVDLYGKFAADDKDPVLSSSWGNCEEINSQADNRLFGDISEEAAAQGQQILTAAGDSGAVDCRGYPAPTGGSISVEEEAAVPWVTGVGGTDLGENTANGTGSTRDEDTWNDGGAGGGGVSTEWPMPAWQHALASARNAPGHSGALCGAGKGQLCREIPDISADADPDLGQQTDTKVQFSDDVGSPGYSIYCGTPNCTLAAEVGVGGLPVGAPPTGAGGWYPIGGTSLSTPLTAAAVVLWDQAAKAKHLNGIGLINPALYEIASNAKKYARDFHDITTDSNDDQYDTSDCPTGCNPSHLYQARKGYDMATGLGSYDATALGADIVAQAGHVDLSPSLVTVYGYTHGHPTTTPVVISSGYKRVRYTAKSSAKWLHVRTGVSTGKLTWSANPKGLAGGTHTAHITVRAHGKATTLTVVYSVSKPAKLHLSAGSLHFSERAVDSSDNTTTATCGNTLWNDELYDAVNDSTDTKVDASTKQTLTISNRGPKGSRLHWQAFYYSETGGWLNVDLTGGKLATKPAGPVAPTGGSLARDHSDPLHLVSIANVNALGGYPRMNQGTYHGVVKIYDLANPKFIKTVPATLVLGTGVGTPTIHSANTSYTVSLPTGSQKTVTLALTDASGSCGYDYSVSSNATWAVPNADDFSGTVPASGSGTAGGSDTGDGTGTVPVVISAAHLAAGNYPVTLTVQSQNAEPNPYLIQLHVHVT